MPYGFGPRLKMLRNSKALSREAWCDVMELSRSTLSQVEKDRYTPNISYLQNLAHKFEDIDFYWLLTGREDPCVSELKRKVAELEFLLSKAEAAQEAYRELLEQTSKTLNAQSRESDQLKVILAARGKYNAA